jgi:transporter family-2 protein
MAAIYAGLALLAGACLAVQVGVNGELRARMDDPFRAAFASFAVGTLALAAYGLISYALAGGAGSPRSSTSAGLARWPWWIWTGGILGAGYIVVTIIFAPKLGAAGWLGVVVAGQILTSILLDHFGLIGFSPRPINPARILGVILLLAGVAVVLRT